MERESGCLEDSLRFSFNGAGIDREEGTEPRRSWKTSPSSLGPRSLDVASMRRRTSSLDLAGVVAVVDSRAIATPPTSSGIHLPPSDVYGMSLGPIPVPRWGFGVIGFFAGTLDAVLSMSGNVDRAKGNAAALPFEMLRRWNGPYLKSPSRKKCGMINSAVVGLSPLLSGRTVHSRTYGSRWDC